ncbi:MULTISPECIES: hypothetical protein [unclassified Marinobacterium]|uniref:hypothetical protein n=1 Tax=unclassified Marinobacterium TaxID=2644139 RepID=UPI00156811FB|nr:MULTISPECIES: hypothetical protein [unclassified Marinobacterium]NRP09028.1 hypothetical protein [Marinobacterium sp. xm-g-48]NRP82441.1 hypothetical protein [Marinobacterium sp. xm-d-509]
MNKLVKPSGVIEFPFEKLGLVDIYPTASRLVLRKNRSSTYVVYKLCYRDRFFKSEANKFSRVGINTVCIESLVADREVAINRLISNEGSNFLYILEGLINILDEIDSKGSEFDFDSIDEWKRFYQEFHRYLERRIDESSISGKPLSRRSAQQQQRALTYYIAALYEDHLTVPAVRRWARQISLKNSKATTYKLGISEDIHQINYTLHYELFKVYSQIIIDKDELGMAERLVPINVRNILGRDSYIYSTIVIFKDDEKGLPGVKEGDIDPSHIVDREYFWETIQEAVDSGFNCFEPDFLKRYKSIIGEKSKLFRSEHRFFDDYAIKIFFVRAIKHFLYALAYESGANKQSLLDVDYRSASADRSGKGLRVFKARAKNKMQTVMWDLKNFGPVYKRFQALMKAMNNLIGMEWDQAGLPTLSIGPRKSGKAQDHDLSKAKYIKLIQEDVNQARLQWPESIKFVNLMDIRPLRDINIMKHSGGDLAVTAQMQGRSMQTTREVYLRKMGIEDAAVELAPFFDLMAQVSKVVSTGVPIRVVEDSSRTASGGCTAEDPSQAARDDSFGEALQEPRCTAHTTCLFCKHYAIHSDKTDIKKLLSLKEYVRSSGYVNTRDIDEFNIKFVPIIDRANDVISQFKLISPSHANMVAECEREILDGELDPFWEMWISTLVGMEVS